MKDLDQEEPEILLKLRDLELTYEDTDEGPNEFKEILNKGVQEYKTNVFNIVELQSKIQLVKKHTSEFAEIMQRLDGLPGSDKVRDGIEEYIESLDMEGLKKRYTESKKIVNRYLECFRSLREVEKFMCFVCLEATCDVFLDPCGHSICSGCSTKLVSRKCPYCRAHITPKVIHWAF